MAKVDVTMPKMGESITEGTVIEWHKQPGDRVEQDETLLEIGTDKVDTEVPSPEAGQLAEILVEEGDTVEVGTRIAVLETEAEASEEAAPEEAPPAGEEEAEEAVAGASAEEEGGEPVEAQQAAQEESQQAASPQAEAKQEAQGEPVAADAKTEIVMPKMGESITEGTVIEWYKQPGDRVEQDETLLEIGTDKVDTEVPSPEAGQLAEILVEEGDTVEVGTVIALLTTQEAGGRASASAEEQTEQVAQEEQKAPAREEAPSPSGDGAVREPQPEGAEAVSRRGEKGQFYSPLVRSIAKEEGLSMQDLESISGSGREGRVTKEDVLSFLEEGGKREEGAAEEPARREARTPSEAVQEPQPAPSSGIGDYDGRVELIEMDRMRQITAEHMVRSKATSAHVTSFAEADVTSLVKLREQSKEAFQEREGIKLTYTPFFVEAAVEALREHPVLNASVREKEIVVKKDYHVGVAVAIGKKGLLAPVIRDAGQKNLVGIAHTASELAERARSKQLQPDDLQGGTFTVTNIGSLGSIMGTPIINQPQVGILATGAIKKRPVVVEDPELGDLIAVRHIMYVSLSYDHRIIDGAMGASFLQKFVDVLESYDAEGPI